MTYNRILLAAVGRDLVAKFLQELEAVFLKFQVVVDDDQGRHGVEFPFITALG